MSKYEEAKKSAIAEFERTYISNALETNGQNVSLTARDIGLDRVYVHRLMRKHGLRPASEKHRRSAALARKESHEEDAAVSGGDGAMSDALDAYDHGGQTP